MAKNTVYRVEFENTTKREKAHRNVRAAEGAGSTDEKNPSISSFTDKDAYREWSAQQTGAQNGDVRYVQIGNDYFKQIYRRGTSEATSGWNGQVIQKSEWDAIQSRPNTLQQAAPQQVTPQQVTPQQVTPQQATPQQATPQQATPQPIKSMTIDVGDGRTKRPVTVQRSSVEGAKKWAEDPGWIRKTGEKIFDPIVRLFGKTTFAQDRKEIGKRAQHMLNVFGNADLVVNSPKGAVSKDIGVDYRGTGGSLWVADPWNPINPKQRLRIVGVNQDVKGGRTVRAAQGAQDDVPPADGEVSAAQPSGPRIVINPAVFHDKRDAACVAWNEAFRLVMEENGFEPVSEPTEAQRKFFADTAYADDELQLRRTILARIATLDTSVKDPTDEQLEETAEMLEMVMEVGAPQNEWEQSAVQRLHDVVVRMRESPREAVESPAPSPKEEGSVTAAMAGGRTMTRGEYEWLRDRQASGASLSTQQRNILDATVDEANKGFVHLQLTGPEPASPESSTPEPASPEPSTPEPTPAQPAQEPSTPAPKPGSMEDYISRGWHFGATGGGLERETIMGTKQYIPQNLVRAPGMRIPNKSEVDWLRRRKADGGRLSAQQEQILAYDDMMSQY